MIRQGSITRAIGGHVIDLFQLATFDVKNPRNYSKFRQIKALAKRSNSRVFIEAGTYLGGTAMRCSRVFERVITMELDPDLHRRSKAYVARRANVLCLEGDASKLLPSILQRSDVRDVLVFLDGHFSGGITAHGDLAEPACEELITLAEYKDKINAIVIDDFRLFGRDAGWPKRSELLRTVEDYFGDGFEFAIHLDQVLIWRISPPR